MRRELPKIEEILGRLTESSAESRTAVGAQVLQIAAVAAIAELTRRVGEIVTTSHSLSGAVESIAARAKEIAVATVEQGRELATIQYAVQEDRRATVAIVAATREQELSARRIERQAGEVVALMQSSGAAVRAGRGRTDMLAPTIETLQAMDVRERGSFGRSEEDAAALAAKAQVQRREIERLRPHESTDEGGR